MRLTRVLLAVATSVVLTGCINSTTLIKLNADGSGTVEQTTLMNTAALKAMPGGSSQTPSATIDRAELEKTAARMGKGVRLVSADPIKGANGFEGSKAIFAFDDINQIQVSQGPSGMGGGPDPRMATEPSGDDPVRFKLTRSGGTSMLTISIVDKPAGGTIDASGGAGSDMPDLTNPMIMNMLKSMFAGFKINVDLEVAGAIVKTNADYVTGSRVTILEMEMEALLADEAKLRALQSKLGPGASLSSVKPYLKDIKGIKIDGPTISVEFR
jgi:hypothetical protein